MDAERPTMSQLLTQEGLQKILNALGADFIQRVSYNVDVDRFIGALRSAINTMFPQVEAVVPQNVANLTLQSIVRATQAYIQRAFAQDELAQRIRDIEHILNQYLPPQITATEVNDVVSRLRGLSAQAGQRGAASAGVARRLLDILGFPRGARGARAAAYRTQETVHSSLVNPQWIENMVIQPLLQLVNNENTIRAQLASNIRTQLLGAIQEAWNGYQAAALNELNAWVQRYRLVAFQSPQQLLDAAQELNHSLGRLRDNALQAIESVLTQIEQQLAAHNISSIERYKQFVNTIEASFGKRPQEGVTAEAQQPQAQATPVSNISDDVINALNRIVGDLRRPHVGARLLPGILQFGVTPALQRLLDELQVIASATPQAGRLLREINNVRNALLRQQQDVSALQDIINRVGNLLNFVSLGNARVVQDALQALNNEIKRLSGGGGAAPAGGALPTGGRAFSKAAVKDPWRALRRLQPSFTPPKQVTQILLWLPRLTEQERAKLTQFLYRYWLAVDKDERKEALKDLVRVAKEMGIPVKG